MSTTVDEDQGIVGHHVVGTVNKRHPFLIEFLLFTRQKLNATFNADADSSSPEDAHSKTWQVQRYDKILRYLLRHGARVEQGSKAWGVLTDEEQAMALAAGTKYDCALPSCEKVGSKVCGRCNAARYCSASCQRQHWKAHKKEGCKAC